MHRCTQSAIRNLCFAAVMLAGAAPQAFAGDTGPVVALHPTPWSPAGKPILGTYNADRMEDLERVRDIGMNVILSGHRELDPATPEGAFCRDNGIKVLPHVTAHVYHGVTLREPISPDQTTIPFRHRGGLPQHGSTLIQLDDELIRYGSMTDSALLDCERGVDGTKAAPHHENMILFWPEPCREEVLAIKDSPNLFGYYVLDDSPGDAYSALRGVYRTIKELDPDKPVCAGFGDAGSIANFGPGVCDILFTYWYPVSTNSYDRQRTALEVQLMLAEARKRVPGIPFVGIYQAFDGRPAQTGQGVPTAEQIREQLEDFVREGASGLVAYTCHHELIPGWADIPALGNTIAAAHQEIATAGGMRVRPEPGAMAEKRLQPQGFWEYPASLPGYVPAWHVAAPFEAPEGLDTALPPDKEIDLAALYTVQSGLAGWRVRETTSGVLGLSHRFGTEKGVVAYAVCDITSPVNQAVQMRLSTDDDASVSLNGEEVYRFNGSRGIELDQDTVPVTLPEGPSRIVVKIHNRAGIWGFFLRFTYPDGRPLDNITFLPESGR
jgi:hypothetical protein